VSRLLEKHPGHRYQTAADVGAELARLRETGSGPAPTPHRGTPVATASVAVLPFRNMSADPDNAFFSDGIAEDLIAALGRIAGLRVVSRASSFRFRDQGADPIATGTRLPGRPLDCLCVGRDRHPRAVLRRAKPGTQGR
jgi:hypothetical protein